MEYEDIVPELLEKIKRDFQEHFNGSEKIAGLYAKVRDGTATYAEANEFAIETGEILAGTFKRNLSSAVLPDGKMYFNIADRTVRPMMEGNYELITDVTSQVQKRLNEDAGIGIKAIVPDLNEDRIAGIVNRVSSEDFYDDVAWLLEEPIKVFSQSIVDDAIKANAEFQYGAGLSPKIVRETAGKCCEWCDKLANTYSYPDVPKGVYQRHDFCRCTVDYVAGKNRKNVHNNRTGKRKYVKDKYGGYTMSKEARVERAKQMAATEEARKEVARQKRIETWGNKKLLNVALEGDNQSGIIEDDILIHKSVGAKTSNYDIELPNKEIVHLTEGTRVTNVKIIAGKGRDRQIDEIDILLDRWGGSESEWQKKKGIGYVDYQGESYKAELHWYEEPTAGRHKWKVKPDADGNWFIEDE